MDKTLLSQLRAKHPDAVTGAACRTATFINPNKMDLGHREWLEANRIAGQGWAVRHMTLKPGMVEGEAEKIAQTYLAGSNKPGQGMAFIDALLKLHEYETAQPLLGYFPDPDDAGVITGAAHYRALAEAEGFAFNGAGIVLPVSGLIVEDGEFDVDTIRSVFDAADRNIVKKEAPDYSRDMRLQYYGDLNVCGFKLQRRLIEYGNNIVKLLKNNCSQGFLSDCSGTLNPFYKPQFSIFEKCLNVMLENMRDDIDKKHAKGVRVHLNMKGDLKTAVNYLEFHALRLSVAWMQEEIRNDPSLGDKARVRKDMKRAIARCAEILKVEEIPDHKHDQLLDFDISRARYGAQKASCDTIELARVLQWFGSLVHLPMNRLPAPPPIRYRRY